MSDREETVALADRIAELLREHSLPMAIAVAIREAKPEPASGPAYIGQRDSGLTRRQWQARIADGRLRAVRVGRRYMTTREWLRQCMEAQPVKPRVGTGAEAS